MFNQIKQLSIEFGIFFLQAAQFSRRQVKKFSFTMLFLPSLYLTEKFQY